MKVAIHASGDRCERAEVRGDCPRSHRWAPEPPKTRDLKLAMHLVFLYVKEIDLVRDQVRPSDVKTAQTRYHSAREVAALLGYGPTETAVFLDVREACDKQGMNAWRGRFGAFIDANWWYGAANNLIEVWNR